MKREFKTPLFSVNEKLPQHGTWVFVITDSYRCMGYIDENGTWRDVQRNQVIEGVRAWSGVTDEETTIWSKTGKTSGEEAGD